MTLKPCFPPRLVPVLSIGLLAVLGILPLAGCSRAPDATPISFAVFGDPAEFAAYQELVARFEQRRPDIDIQLQHIPSQSDYRKRLAASFSGGEPPDVFLLNYRRFATYAADGSLAPLDEFLDGSRILRREAYFPITMAAFTWEDQLWCIPQNVSSLVVYYNKDLFTAAGVPFPEEGWSREDFVDAARKLTLDLDGDGRTDQFGAGIEPNLFRLAPFVWQDGLDIVDDPLRPSRLVLDDPRVLETFRWFADLQRVEGVAPDAVAEAAEPLENRWLNGRLAMLFNSRRGVPTYRTIDSFSWDVAPLPVGRQAAGILHADGYCLASAADNKEAAWTFIEFANSFEGQTIVAASGRTVPSLIAVAESEAFLTPDLPPAQARVFIETIPLLRAVPVIRGWTAVEDLASKEIERAFYGLASVEEAAADAGSFTAPYFSTGP